MNSWGDVFPPIYILITALLLPKSLSLAWRPTLGRVLVVPNLFHLWIMEAIVLIGTLNAADIFLYPSPDLCLDVPVSEV